MTQCEVAEQCVVGESEGLTQPALLGDFQTQPPGSPAHVSSILPWSDGIPVVTFFQSLDVFWVPGRKGTLFDSEITKMSVGCTRTLKVWAWWDTRKRVWWWDLELFETEWEKNPCSSKYKLLDSRNKEKCPFCLGLYRWQCFALLLHLWC